MATTPENAATWRDLADQLTEGTRCSLELLEQEMQGSARARAKLLEIARNDIEERLADAVNCDVVAPADAAWVGEWEKNVDREGWSRQLRWRSYGTPSGISVDIDGCQQCDGTFTRDISVWGVDGGGELTSSRARETAALLIEAADQLDRWQHEGTSASQCASE